MYALQLSTTQISDKPCKQPSHSLRITRCVASRVEILRARSDVTCTVKLTNAQDDCWANATYYTRNHLHTTQTSPAVIPYNYTALVLQKFEKDNE